MENRMTRAIYDHSPVTLQHLYTTAFGYLGTFFFGGVPFASFHMKMTGAEPECFLVFGDDVGAEGFMPGSFMFGTGLSGIDSSYEVLMDDYPTFTIPTTRGALIDGGAVAGSGSVSGAVNYPGFVGPDGTFAVQVMMWNPIEVPDQPEQYSPVLKGWISPTGQVFARTVGEGSIDIALEVGVNAKGETTFSFPFAIAGF